MEIRIYYHTNHYHHDCIDQSIDRFHFLALTIHQLNHSLIDHIKRILKQRSALKIIDALMN